MGKDVPIPNSPLPTPYSPLPIPHSLSANRNPRSRAVLGLIDRDPEFLGLHYLARGLGAGRGFDHLGVADDLFPGRSVLGIWEGQLNRLLLSVFVMHRHIVIAGGFEIVARVGGVSRVTQGGFNGVAAHAEFDALVFTHHLGLCHITHTRRNFALRAESKAADHAESDRNMQQSVHSRLSFARISAGSGRERSVI